MSEALQTLAETTSEATRNAIFSQASLFGPTPSGLPDGPTAARCGPGAAPVPVSARRAKGQGLQTLVTSGRSGIASSASAALQSSLESRLLPRLDMAGSTLFVETWKRRNTPLRRRYWEHTARAPRTSASACTSLLASVATPDTLHSQASLATPAARDFRTANLKTYQERGGGSKGEQLQNQVKQLVASGPDATGGTDATASGGQLNPAYSRWLMGLPPVWCDCAVTAMQSVRRRLKSLSKATSKPGT
jgi:hypothetical protein